MKDLLAQLGPPVQVNMHLNNRQRGGERGILGTNVEYGIWKLIIGREGEEEGDFGHKYNDSRLSYSKKAPHPPPQPLLLIRCIYASSFNLCMNQDRDDSEIRN